MSSLLLATAVTLAACGEYQERTCVDVALNATVDAIWSKGDDLAIDAHSSDSYCSGSGDEPYSEHRLQLAMSPVSLDATTVGAYAVREREPPTGANVLLDDSFGSGDCASCELTIEPAESGTDIRVVIAIRPESEVSTEPVVLTIERAAERIATIGLDNNGARLIE